MSSSRSRCTCTFMTLLRGQQRRAMKMVQSRSNSMLLKLTLMLAVTTMSCHAAHVSLDGEVRSRTNKKGGALMLADCVTKKKLQQGVLRKMGSTTSFAFGDSKSLANHIMDMVRDQLKTLKIGTDHYLKSFSEDLIGRLKNYNTKSDLSQTKYYPQKYTDKIEITRLDLEPTVQGTYLRMPKNAIPLCYEEYNQNAMHDNTLNKSRWTSTIADRPWYLQQNTSQQNMERQHMRPQEAAFIHYDQFEKKWCLKANNNKELYRIEEETYFPSLDNKKWERNAVAFSNRGIKNYEDPEFHLKAIDVPQHRILHHAHVNHVIDSAGKGNLQQRYFTKLCVALCALHINTFLKFLPGLKDTRKQNGPGDFYYYVDVDTTFVGKQCRMYVKVDDAGEIQISEHVDLKRAPNSTIRSCICRKQPQEEIELCSTPKEIFDKCVHLFEEETFSELFDEDDKSILSSLLSIFCCRQHEQGDHDDIPDIESKHIVNPILQRLLSDGEAQI